MRARSARVIKWIFAPLSAAVSQVAGREDAGNGLQVFDRNSQMDHLVVD